MGHHRDVTKLRSEVLSVTTHPISGPLSVLIMARLFRYFQITQLGVDDGARFSPAYANYTAHDRATAAGSSSISTSNANLALAFRSKASNVVMIPFMNPTIRTVVNRPACFCNSDQRSVF